MRVLDYFDGVGRVFSANRGRTALTLLGIMIGSGTIVLLAGLLRGGQEALLNTGQRAAEADMIQVRRDEPPPPQIGKTRRVLSRRDTDSLHESPLLGGVEVASERSREGEGRWKGRKKRMRLVTATPNSLELNRLELHAGRFLTDEDLALRRRVAVVGWEIWRELLDEEAPLDRVHVEFAGAAWEVVGVLANKPPLMGGGEGTWMWNRKALVPQTTFDALYDPAHGVERIYVRLKGHEELASHIKVVEGVVKQTLLRDHLGVQNFQVEGEDGFAAKMRLILFIIRALLLGTGILSLVVGGINIMNIMLVTVTERTREIGIRRAIGAPPRAILVQFLLESGLIAVVGGLIGVGGGLLLSAAAAALLAHLLGSWPLHIETWSIVLGLLLSLSTGIVFGLFPAWRAARLNPVEALRYE